MGHSTAVRVLATGPDVSQELMCRAVREGSHHCLFRDVISSSKDIHSKCWYSQVAFCKLCHLTLARDFANTDCCQCFSSFCCCSVAYLYPTLCDPMDCDMPGSLSVTVSWSLLRFMSNCNLKNGLILIMDGIEQFPWVFQFYFLLIHL